MFDQLTKDVLAKLLHSRSIETRPAIEQVIHLHFHTGGRHWWIAGFDHDQTFLCFACLGAPEAAEWGYVTLGDLELQGAELEIFQPPKPFKEIPWWEV